MNILFTRSNTWMSKIIREVTGEPVSHCAIRAEGFVIHVNLLGLQIEKTEDFYKTNQLIYHVELGDGRIGSRHAGLTFLLEKISGKGRMAYDIGALLYLGARYILPFLPKKNLWQCTGMYLCTELITEILDNKEDSMITPYKLYLKLANKE
jgi:hypothetical protein